MKMSDRELRLECCRIAETVGAAREAYEWITEADHKVGLRPDKSDDVLDAVECLEEAIKRMPPGKERRLKALADVTPAQALKVINAIGILSIP